MWGGAGICDAGDDILHQVFGGPGLRLRRGPPQSAPQEAHSSQTQGTACRLLSLYFKTFDSDYSWIYPPYLSTHSLEYSEELSALDSQKATFLHTRPYSFVS